MPLTHHELALPLLPYSYLIPTRARTLFLHTQALDDLNRFCSTQGLAPDLKRRLRQYFHQRKHIMLSRSAAGVIHKMSTSLQVSLPPNPTP